MGDLIFSALRKLARSYPDLLTDIANIPGVIPLYEFLYEKTKPRGTILIECEGNKMYVNTDDRYIGPLLIMQAYERQQTRLFKGILGPGMVVLDIGANIGYYSLIAARIVGPAGTVYAFEPEPRNHELLVKNINLNGYSNVTPIQKAVSNKHGKVRLFIDRVNLGAHSFSRDNNEKNAGSIEVEATTVDDFLGGLSQDNEVDLIRMDVEGAEGLVIEGANHTLRNSNVKLMMEFSPRQLRNVGTDPQRLLRDLRDQGFRPRVVDEFNRCIKDGEGMDIVRACEKARYGHLELFLER